MKIWLKGGLIGAVTGFVLCILSFVVAFALEGFKSQSTGPSSLILMILWNIALYLGGGIPCSILYPREVESCWFYGGVLYNPIFFLIVGIIVGLIIKKIKNK